MYQCIYLSRASKITVKTSYQKQLVAAYLTNTVAGDSYIIENSRFHSTSDSRAWRVNWFTLTVLKFQNFYDGDHSYRGIILIFKQN